MTGNPKEPEEAIVSEAADATASVLGGNKLAEPRQIKPNELVGLDVRAEGRENAVFGGEVVAEFTMGHPKVEETHERVQVISVSNPNLDYIKHLDWFPPEQAEDRIALIALDRDGTIKGVAVLPSGREVVLGRQGTLQWAKYSAGYQPPDWDPFKENNNISREQLRLLVSKDGKKLVITGLSLSGKSNTWLQSGKIVPAWQPSTNL